MIWTANIIPPPADACTADLAEIALVDSTNDPAMVLGLQFPSEDCESKKVASTLQARIRAIIAFRPLTDALRTDKEVFRQAHLFRGGDELVLILATAVPQQRVVE